MPTASIFLPDGTKITVDGSADEVERILKVYSTANSLQRVNPSERKRSSRKGGASKPVDETNTANTPDLSAIVNMIHDCDEAEAISSQILDKKDVLNRVLLPLYIVHKYFGDMWGLTSGDVAKISEDLKVKVHIADASRKLSGQGKSYLQADKIRKKGGAGVRYKLNRRGIQFFEELLKC